MKQQVLVIHGGTSFDSYDEYIEFIKTRELSAERLQQTYDWKAALPDDLGDEFEVLQPRMPNSTNVRYEEWKLWFERCCEFVQPGVVLIGHSLGGVFLAKYLAENEFPCEIKATLLVAAPYADVSTDESLTEFALPDSLDRFAEQGGAIHLIHSEDDPVVPFSEVAQYQELLPSAKTLLFEDRQHFNQEHFPELIDLVSALQ